SGHERERSREPRLDGHPAAEARVRRGHDLGGERDPRAARVEVEPERRHRLDALPRDQPAARGRDRVQADVHGLQARGARSGAGVPRYRHGLERRMTAAQTIAEWTTALTLDGVPEDVVEHAKLHLLDVIGCGHAASALGVAIEGRTAMAELGGEPQASVIGLDSALPAPNAAFANAMLCHGLDYDDTHSDSVSHVSVVVGTAALATAEETG